VCLKSGKFNGEDDDKPADLEVAFFPDKPTVGHNFLIAQGSFTDVDFNFDV